MDYERIAERVTGMVAGRGKEYKEYFEKKLKKWKVKSPAEIPDDKKDDFFEEVDKGWNSADESGKDGKKAGLMMRRGRTFAAEKAPLSGLIADIVDGKTDRVEGKKLAKDDARMLLGIYYALPGSSQSKFDKLTLAELLKMYGKSLKLAKKGVEAGCEKLPAGPMRENCEKKKKDGEKSKDDDKKEDKKPDFLKKKEKSKKAVRPPEGPYATLIFEKYRVLFTMLPAGSQNVRTGFEPYRNDPEAAISRVFKLFKMNGVKGSDVEVLA